MQTAVLVHNSIHVHILQSPSETRSAKKRNLSSVPLLLGCLKNANVHLYKPKECKKILPQQIIEAINSGTAVLLFPSKDSLPLTTFDASITTLIAPDSSWPEAMEMLRTGDGRLRPNRIRHIRLPDDNVRVSLYEQYGIRHEPGEGYLSTLEAVVEALKILEPLCKPQCILDEFERYLRSIKLVEDEKKCDRFEDTK